MSVFATIFTSLISPVTNYFTKREEGRQLKAKAEAKFKSAKQAGQLDVTLTDAEWESISVSKQDSSWKDELITITFMLPIICIFLGSIWAAFTGNTALLDGTVAGIEALKVLGLDFDYLTTAVVLAGIGIKATRQMFK
jgi:hypothetical protein